MGRPETLKEAWIGSFAVSRQQPPHYMGGAIGGMQDWIEPEQDEQAARSEDQLVQCEKSQ